MPKISQRPAQSGADVADGDLIGIIDVGSPNLDERITVAEFAQAPQFSSRYVSKSDDEVVWISASMLDSAFGSPSRGNPNQWFSFGTAWLFDASNDETVSGSIIVPEFWTTFKFELYWANASSSSGNVVWAPRARFAGDGEQVDGSGTSSIINVNRTIAAPSTIAELEVTQFPASSNLTNVVGKPLFVAVTRVAADAADTLANDAAVYGILLTRMS